LTGAPAIGTRTALGAWAAAGDSRAARMTSAPALEKGGGVRYIKPATMECGSCRPASQRRRRRPRPDKARGFRGRSFLEVLLLSAPSGGPLCVSDWLEGE